jgi:hypothetical protein
MTLEGNFITVDFEYFGTPLMENLSARLFFSTSDGFSIEDAEYVSNISAYDPVFYFELADLPFDSGTTVYCRGSLFTSGSNSYYIGDGQYYVYPIDNYYDETLGITVYPNITEESDQYAFVLP